MRDLDGQATETPTLAAGGEQFPDLRWILVKAERLKLHICKIYKGHLCSGKPKSCLYHQVLLSGYESADLDITTASCFPSSWPPCWVRLIPLQPS